MQKAEDLLFVHTNFRLYRQRLAYKDSLNHICDVEDDHFDSLDEINFGRLESEDFLLMNLIRNDYV